MIVCLAGLEGSMNILNDLEDGGLDYGLISFYYLKNQEQLEAILKKVKYLLIDSGAHSFQHGKAANFDEYTEMYAKFIKRNTDNPQILGFFEMDIDNVIGYDGVLRLRKKLTAVSDKIIPVWHQNRGIGDYIKTCEEWKGRRVAITGFANQDQVDGQFNYFINEAHAHDCLIHILGFTRFKLITRLNLGLYDSVDSSTWIQAAVYNEIMLPNHGADSIRYKFLRGLKWEEEALKRVNFITAKKMQLYYKDIDQSVYGHKQTNPLRNDGSEKSRRKEIIC